MNVSENHNIFFSNLWIKQETATLISFNSLIFVRYLLYISVTAQISASHKYEVEKEIETLRAFLMRRGY